MQIICQTIQGESQNEIIFKFIFLLHIQTKEDIIAYLKNYLAFGNSFNEEPREKYILVDFIFNVSFHG